LALAAQKKPGRKESAQPEGPPSLLIAGIVVRLVTLVPPLIILIRTHALGRGAAWFVALAWWYVGAALTRPWPLLPTVAHKARRSNGRQTSPPYGLLAYVIGAITVLGGLFTLIDLFSSRKELLAQHAGPQGFVLVGLESIVALVALVRYRTARRFGHRFRETSGWRVVQAKTTKPPASVYDTAMQVTIDDRPRPLDVDRAWIASERPYTVDIGSGRFASTEYHVDFPDHGRLLIAGRFDDDGPIAIRGPGSLAVFAAAIGREPHASLTRCVRSARLFALELTALVVASATILVIT
jgi:hypothetical protein